MVKAKHLFLLSAMVDKMDLDQEMQLLTNKKKGKQAMTNEEIGQKVVFALAKKLHRAQEETLEFIAAVTGKTKTEVEDMAIGELVDTFKSILGEDGVLDFLSNRQET